LPIFLVIYLFLAFYCFKADICLFQSIFSKKEENEPHQIFVVTALATAPLHNLLRPFVEKPNFVLM